MNTVIYLALGVMGLIMVFAQVQLFAIKELLTKILEAQAK